jgi:hypothetical protein
MIESVTATAQLALDTILQKPVRGIPSWLINPMEHRTIDRLAGEAEGTYRQKPIETYRSMLVNIGTCLLDQWIPDNPLSMGDHGFDSATKQQSATTGATRIERDGMLIDSPEAVVAHMEMFVFPQLQKATAEFDEVQQTKKALAEERRIQKEIGPTMLKSGYGFVRFPAFAYGAYGYEHYFSAYALYPEVIERHFSLQADLALRINRAAARAFVEGKLPPLFRLDHDMAGSQGMLVNIKSLERIWFPHFARCLEPMLKTNVRMIWHCDGNLMDMVPRLLDVGIRGFQGFQYEDGMDYEKICRMKDREGRDLIIIAGVSVTTTLPHGTPADVKREMEWLVRCGPKTGLFLAGSSSIAPGVPWENMRTLVEGFRYYQERGRAT